MSPTEPEKYGKQALNILRMTVEPEFDSELEGARNGQKTVPIGWKVWAPFSFCASPNETRILSMETESNVRLLPSSELKSERLMAGEEQERTVREVTEKGPDRLEEGLAGRETVEMDWGSNVGCDSVELGAFGATSVSVC